MGQPAARIHDDVRHHKGAGPIVEGCPTVRIGGAGLLAARVGDKVKHGKGVEPITQGEPTVRIGGAGLFAARVGDKVACSGVLAQGCGTVRIGRDPAEECLIEGSEEAAAFIVPVENK